MKTILCLLVSAVLSVANGQHVQAERWNAACIPASREAELRSISLRIMQSKGRYEAVASKANTPWFVVAGLHNMESGGSFRCHLHEGSPLTGRTRDVPKGRPVKGHPPFAWEESAIDALEYDSMWSVRWTSLEAMLWAMERYNGTGYEKYHPTVPTPYLWAGTTIERPGKYVADGKWSPTARSSQTGIAAILKYLTAQGAVRMPP